MKKTIVAFIAILLVGVLLQQHFKRSGANDGGSVEGPVAPPSADDPQEKISVKADTKGWLTYTNKKVGFTVLYPSTATLRGTEESDVAIVEPALAETENKKTLITIRQNKVPVGREPYATMEVFWADESGFIASQSGTVSNERYVEVNGRVFWEAREDNRLNNFMGLHRYIKIGEAIYEVSLAVAGDRLLDSAQDLYNEMLTTFVLNN